MSASADAARPATRVIEGAGVLSRLGELASQHGRKLLLVTDPGLVACGHVARVSELLRAAGLELRSFDRVRENPTTLDVEACLAFAREEPPEVLIGFGGGSSIDVAKGVNFLLSRGGRLADYEGRGDAGVAMLPLIAVPTTAGTGSEVQSFALIAEPVTHRKMACGDPAARPRIALLDPELSLSMPRTVAACTGLDAIGHALETAVTTAGDDASRSLAREALALAARAFPIVLARPGELPARADMLRAASLAGLAIEASMLGAAHSMANPMTAHFGIPHGQAVAMALPWVVRFNAQDQEAARLYAELALVVVPAVSSSSAVRNGGADPADPGTRAGGEPDAETLARLIEHFLDLAGFPRSLAAFGANTGHLATLASEAAGQWTARFNPRPVAAADFEQLFSRLTAIPSADNIHRST